MHRYAVARIAWRHALILRLGAVPHPQYGRLKQSSNEFARAHGLRRSFDITQVGTLPENRHCCLLCRRGDATVVEVVTLCSRPLCGCSCQLLAHPSRSWLSKAEPSETDTHASCGRYAGLVAVIGGPQVGPRARGSRGGNPWCRCRPAQDCQTRRVR